MSEALLYRDDTPEALDAMDLQDMVIAGLRNGQELVAILTTEALESEYRRQVVPQFRTDPMMLANVPVLASPRMPVGEAWLINGRGERVGLLQNRTA